MMENKEKHSFLMFLILFAGASFSAVVAARGALILLMAKMFDIWPGLDVWFIYFPSVVRAMRFLIFLIFLYPFCAMYKDLSMFIVKLLRRHHVE